MADEVKYSVIGIDGKVRWLEKKQADTFIDEKGGQYISNPKEVYYPQYDQTLSTRKSEPPKEEVAVFSVENANTKLGIIIL